MTSPSSEPPRYPQPVAGLVLYFGVVAVGIAAAQFLPEGAALVATPILMVAATALAVVAFRVDARATLLLRLPSATDLLMAFPLTISFFILDDQLAGLSHARFPIPEDTLDDVRRLLTANTPGEWVEKIALIGVGAAVSEELMFRGFMQTAFLQRLRRPVAITLTAALFMVLHIQFLPVLAAGIVLGFVALATRSIVIPMFVHFCNNVIQLLLFNLAGLETLGDPVWIPLTILVPGLVMFGLSWGYYLRRLEPEPETPDETRSAPEPAPITIPHNPRPLGDELASISPTRRWLGWLVVAAAMMGGAVVLTGLFGWSVYMIHPERAHARLVAALEDQIVSNLEPEASDKEAQIASAFRALAALNDSGQLEPLDLIVVTRAYLELRADGGLNAEDADALVETIRLLVMERTSPREL